MNSDDLLKSSCEWLKGTGPAGDIVISSRVRLARNVRGFPFTSRLTSAQQNEIIGHFNTARKRSNYLKGANFMLYDELSDLQKQYLLERHLASLEHTTKKGKRALCYDKKEVMSIMVLEEDHLRLQVMQSGFNLIEAWRLLSRVDTELEKSLHFAFHPTLGYLTACPTNVGTGLRASCMLHLPCLVMTKQITKVLQALAKLNLAARGLYGEGTEASGNFFQFSNQITLGQSEEDIIDNLERVIKQVIEHEKEAREVMQKKRGQSLFDQIGRALGVLKYARTVSSKESTGLLSHVRLGVDLGIIKNLDYSVVNKLFLTTQPAHLQMLAGKGLGSAQRDIYRANLIREKLKNVEV